MVELKMIKKLVSGLFLALTFALLAGCQGPGATAGFPPVAEGPAAAPTSEKFNPGDLVIVTFSGLSDAVIPPHEERVKEDGTITLPFIGSVVAQGKGPGELQKEIRSRFIAGKIYPESLNVTVKGQDRFYFVGGEVRSPNRYIYVEGTTVLKAIQSAGDFTDFARKSRVSVTRLDGRKFTINCEKALEKPELDLPVYPGDRVHVPRRFL